MKPGDKLEIHDSSGNVFADLGVKNPEEYLAKAKLASQISEIVGDMKQKDVAARLGIDQPKVSDLLNGRLSAFSISRLIGFLNKLDQDVQIVVRPAVHTRKNDGRGHLSVSI